MFELGGLNTIFKLECLTICPQGRGGGKIFKVFGVLAEIERNLLTGLCGEMGTSWELHVCAPEPDKLTVMYAD